MPEIRLALDARNMLGECPVWSIREQALYWEDILAPAIYRWTPSTGEVKEWTLPAPVGAFGLRANGGLIVGLKTGVYFLDLETGQLTLVVRPESDQPSNRLNDGKVSPEGRFWIGSMFDVAGVERQPTGSLYRIDPDGSCHRILDGLYVSNGLAWSPDGRTMYHSDSRQMVITAYDYNPETGTLGASRIIARPDETDGRPDGGTVDVDGCYWSAGVSAGCLNRYRPDGTLAAKIPVPTPSPTMACFGGRDMRTVFITSHRERREKLSSFPEAGGIFSFEHDIAGLPASYFAG